MKKVTVILFITVLLITMIFAGCVQKEEEVTVNETSSVSVESTEENGTSQTNQQSDAEKSEADSKETSQNSTTAKATEKAADKTTTKKQTTTKKSTNQTTKKATTTKASRCTNNNNHSMSCGDMGRWFNSRSELFDYYMSVSDSWTSKFDRGEIDYDTMVENCPMGYECWSCAYCGKWTGNFKYA